MKTPADRTNAEANSRPNTSRPLNRPREVVWAAQSQIASILLGLPGTVIVLAARRNSPDLIFKVLDYFVILGFVLWLTLMVYRGHKWARILFVANFALGAVLIAPSLPALFLRSWILFLVFVTQSLMQCFTIWLIFTEPGRRWYLKRDADDNPSAA
jgi:hypothetical protein